MKWNFPITDDELMSSYTYDPSAVESAAEITRFPVQHVVHDADKTTEAVETWAEGEIVAENETAVSQIEAAVAGENVQNIGTSAGPNRTVVVWSGWNPKAWWRNNDWWSELGTSGVLHACSLRNALYMLIMTSKCSSNGSSHHFKLALTWREDAWSIQCANNNKILIQEHNLT